jgi:hypothetical protein
VSVVELVIAVGSPPSMGIKYKLRMPVLFDENSIFFSSTEN